MRVRTGLIATAALWLAVAASAPWARPSAASAADDRSGSRGSDSSGSGSGRSFSGHSALDAALAAVLQNAGFTGEIESTLERRLGRPIDRQARRPRPAALVRHDPLAAPRQHLRRLPLADQRLRRHAVDRHRRPEQQRRRPEPQRPAQPAPLADGGQHGVLSELDVERPLLRAVGRSVRQLAGLHVPAARGQRRASRPAIRVVTHLLSAQAHIPPTELVEVAGFTGTRRHRSGPTFDQFDDGLGDVRAAARRAAASATSRSARRCSTRLNATPEYRALFGELFPEVSGRRPDRLHDVRPGDRRVRVHADLRRRADRPLRARRPSMR